MSWLGLLSYLGRDVPDFMDGKLAEKTAHYAKTREKSALVRSPSLTDPAWREGVRASLVERARATLPAGGAVDYCMGDEMSLTSYTRFHDFDWSESSLADFRRWLRQRYPDLQALNAAWGTAFASWEEVLPLTREEAREAANPAPWFEFRTYMNDQLAGFYTFVQETIRGVDPQARCGLSGTQSPEAGNGMDWWKLASSFSYYHSYNTSWSNEMRRSFQGVGGAAQSPYNSGYSAVNPNAENRMWWCLFHDTRGISAWCTSLFFYGDFTESESGRDTRAHLREFRRGV
ncbi:MAG: beta-galactosidase, partial [Lentisphaeria bacterium]|nr:beta-galactosidase [Lentisphaeria bacterium]